MKLTKSFWKAHHSRVAYVRRRNQQKLDELLAKFSTPDMKLIGVAGDEMFYDEESCREMITLGYKVWVDGIKYGNFYTLSAVPNEDDLKNFLPIFHDEIAALRRQKRV